MIETQALWHILAEAQAFCQAGELHHALKSIDFIDKIADDFEEDFYDFHSWAPRKTSLRSYSDMCAHIGTIRQEQASYQAALLLGIKVSHHLSLVESLD